MTEILTIHEVRDLMAKYCPNMYTKHMSKKFLMSAINHLRIMRVEKVDRDALGRWLDKMEADEDKALRLAKEPKHIDSSEGFKLI